MTDIDSKDSVSADTNGLGSVVIQIHGQGKVLHLTSCEARALAVALQEKATLADFQNSTL